MLDVFHTTLLLESLLYGDNLEMLDHVKSLSLIEELNLNLVLNRIGRERSLGSIVNKEVLI